MLRIDPTSSGTYAVYVPIIIKHLFFNVTHVSIYLVLAVIFYTSYLTSAVFTTLLIRRMVECINDWKLLTLRGLCHSLTLKIQYVKSRDVCFVFGTNLELNQVLYALHYVNPLTTIFSPRHSRLQFARTASSVILGASQLTVIFNINVIT